MSKKQLHSSLLSYLRAPGQLVHGRTDGATVNKAVITILAGGVVASLLVFVAVKIWAACSEYSEPPYLPFICTDDVAKTSWTAALARGFERETIVPLRVELKPFERIVIGDIVLINSGTRI